MEQWIEQYGYLALMIGTFFEGETIIFLASALVYNDVLQFPLTVMAAFMGSFVSDWLYFMIGRINGKYFIEKRENLKSKVKPVNDFFLKNQVQILFSYRFLYGFRIIIPLLIGMSGLHPFRFLVYSICSGLIWATTICTTGYWVGRIFDIKYQFYQDHILYFILGFACFGFMIGYIIKRLAFGKIFKPEASGFID